MNEIVKLRERLGMSQQQLAFYLSVTLSHLKMVEQQHRSLPVAAMQKLAPLLTMDFSDAVPQQELSQPKHTAKEDKTLFAQARRCSYMAEKLRLQLETMQVKYRQAQNAVLFTSQLLQQQLPDGEEGEKDKIWLELLQRETAVKLKKYSPAAQRLLQWKIDCFVFGAARATELVGAVSNKI